LLPAAAAAGLLLLLLFQVRINPAGQPAASSHRPPNIIEQWQK
jgi:hypothetical protein